MSNEKTKLQNRDTLKGYFKNGQRPNEENFETLIDSTINKLEDGISKEQENGLVLAPEGATFDRLLSFVNKIGSERPDWSVSLIKGEQPGLAIVRPTAEGENDEIKMFFHENGNIGINTNKPSTHLDVKGVMGIESRIGTYKVGLVDADGKWNDVTPDLYGCKAFEVIAQVGGEQGEGKYALLHATALATHGQRVNRIRRTTQAFFGWWWWNRLTIRWKRTELSREERISNAESGFKYNYKYKLQLKTRSNYGDGIKIKYHITSLWNNEIASMIEAAHEAQKADDKKTAEQTD